MVLRTEVIPILGLVTTYSQQDFMQVWHNFNTTLELNGNNLITINIMLRMKFWFKMQDFFVNNTETNLLLPK